MTFIIFKDFLFLLQPKINEATKAHNFVNDEKGYGDKLTDGHVVGNCSTKEGSKASHKNEAQDANDSEELIHVISFC